MTRYIPEISLFSHRRWMVAAVMLVVLISAAGFWIDRTYIASRPVEAPEAGKVLAVQDKMPFQILIPAYLPEAFDRASVEVNVQQTGPSGEPMIQLTYHTRQGASLFVRQWVPAGLNKETLAGSWPIDTRWGDGSLLTQDDNLIVIWADIGPLRVSVFSSNTDILSTEQIVATTNSLGPTSNEQVFASIDATPAPPVEVKPDEQGVQNLTLVVTPGGYSPLHFSVKRGLPVRLVFRQLGQVGSGKELIFPTGHEKNSSLLLKNAQDQQVLEFTPQTTGDFIFRCPRNTYRGVMTVKP
jgi:hypothetical protein